MMDQAELQKILDEFGIIPLPKYIMDMDLKEIRQYFGYPTTDGIQKILLMRNLLWQIFQKIKSGNAPDFYKKNGFIRGMWYYIKKKFSEHKPLRGDLYGTMVSELTDMVRKGLFNYSDFNFRDRDSDTWKLGFDNPHIILMAEKDGYVTIMEDLQKNYGCHVITAGGMPSFMTVNYMVSEMKKFETDLNQTFYVITFTDFDPTGHNISEEFTKHLNNSGLKNLFFWNQWGGGNKECPWLSLSVPANFNKSIKDVWYVLPKDTWDNPTTKEWVDLTGGLDGSKWKPGQQTHGLESDEFDFDEINKMFETAITPLLKDSSDKIKKRNAMMELRKNFEDMAMVKFLNQIQNP